MSWKDAIRANHRAIHELSEPELKLVLPILRDLREEVARNFYKFFKNAGTEESYSRAKHAGLMIQLQDVFESIESELSPAMLRELKIGTGKATLFGAKNMMKMAAAGEKKFKGVIGGLNINLARIVLDAKLSVAHRHDSSRARYAGEVGKRIRRDMAIGLVKGESIDSIAKRLLAGNYQRLKNKGPAALAEGYAEQNFFRNHADAVRLVRTELVNGYSVAQDKSLQEANAEDPGWLMMWDGASDKRVCDDCAYLNGKTAKPGGTFPGGVRHPPLHPNDRCGLRPHRKEWE